jgi:hypothetical protein
MGPDPGSGSSGIFARAAVMMFAFALDPPGEVRCVRQSMAARTKGGVGGTLSGKRCPKTPLALINDDR